MGVAQLVEHWSPKPGVVSSSLTAHAMDEYKIKCRHLATFYFIPFILQDER